MPMNRKLVLVNPINQNNRGLAMDPSARTPPLNLAYIAAVTPPGWDIVLLDEQWEPFSYEPADLVGITALTATAPRAYAIAAQYRAQGIPVILGGIHASLCQEDALRHVDAIVVGEGEAAWPELVADYTAGQMKKIYQKALPDLTSLPIPRRDLFNKKYQITSLQTSRGCPMDCEFCSVTAMSGKQYRRRPIADVIREYETLEDKLVFIIDDNLIGYSGRDTDNALALFKAMATAKVRRHWFCQASLNFSEQPELLKWARRSGCESVIVGLEADDASALDEIHKFVNLKHGVANLAADIQKIRKSGITVLGCLIFGMDSDNREKLLQRAHMAIHCGLDIIQATVLQPLPGTRLWEKMHSQGRILYNDFPDDWVHFDSFGLVHQPLLFTPEEFKELMRTCYHKMYAMPVILKKSILAGIVTRNWLAPIITFQTNMSYRKAVFHYYR